MEDLLNQPPGIIIFCGLLYFIITLVCWKEDLYFGSFEIRKANANSEFYYGKYFFTSSAIVAFGLLKHYDLVI
jgi:hypothetical protein